MGLAKIIVDLSTAREPLRIPFARLGGGCALLSSSDESS